MSASQTRIIIQARTSSSRLPAKSLLPICGFPLAVLAAKRAMLGGLEAVVATSNEASDDNLAAELDRHEIPVVRGSLHNVLERFDLATSDMKDEDICVRLTADNAFPNGRFVQILVDEFAQENCGYMNTSAFLPYGLAAEVFRVEAIRNALAEAESAYDFEHVTPWIRRNRKCVSSTYTFVDEDLSKVRCTIDTLDDYDLVTRVFRSFADPVTVDFVQLTEAIIDQSPSEPAAEVNAGRQTPELVVGAAQLGMDYGRTNAVGAPSPGEAVKLIEAACNHGVTQFDTARVYGDSESRIGAALQLLGEGRLTPITKLAPLPDDAQRMSEKAICGLVDNSVFQSLYQLQLRKIPVLLLHRASLISDFGGVVWKRLEKLRDEGLIGVLGASIQSLEELELAVRQPGVGHLQIPYNLLDGRWDAFFSRFSKPDALTIHVRSVFLQGLLLSEEEDVWPDIAGVNGKQLVAEIDALVTKLDRRNRQDLCIAFARAPDWVDGVVIGMETATQLLDNIGLFEAPPLSQQQSEIVRDVFGDIPDQLLNPAFWKQVS